MGAEIKQTLERNYDVVMSAQEIRQLSFGKLKALGMFNKQKTIFRTNPLNFDSDSQNPDQVKQQQHHRAAPQRHRPQQLAMVLKSFSTTN